MSQTKIDETTKATLRELSQAVNSFLQKEFSNQGLQTHYTCQLCKVGPCKLKLRKDQQTIWYYQCNKCKKRFGCDSALADHHISGKCPKETYPDS